LSPPPLEDCGFAQSSPAGPSPCEDCDLYKKIWKMRTFRS
jgi:hypothetical protein